MTTTLKAHPIWQELTQALAQINLDHIANQHLQDCQAEIHGYWDENDQPYETIRFKQTPIPQLVSSSLGISPKQTNRIHALLNPAMNFLLIAALGAAINKKFIAKISNARIHYWLQLRYALTIPPATTVGELLLILDDDLEVIDENWLVDVESPYVDAIVDR